MRPFDFHAARAFPEGRGRVSRVPEFPCLRAMQRWRDVDSPDLLRLLKKHWGYSEFRPKQESIVQSILSGRDAAVVMPTGGGKSLCYQLPAAAMERTCMVVSPLIA